MENIYKILEDPMLPEHVGINFQEFTLLLDGNRMVPGDMVLINENEAGIHEDVAVIQYLPLENKDGPGWYYTMQLCTRYENYSIYSKYLQKDCSIIHIGACYSE